jgi:sigma-B regulation protein RsbU (phosphoserine phosphatase)
MSSSGNHPAILQELVLLADDLVGVESGRELLRGLERQLGRISCLPAYLYLSDPGSGGLYPAAALGPGARAMDELEELPGAMVYQPGRREFPLFKSGQPVGLLRVETEAFDERIMQRLAVLLGPALDGVQLQEATVRELRQVHEQMQMLLSAGSLLKHLDLEVLLVRILETILTSVKAQVGAVLTVDEHNVLCTRVTWGIQDHHVEALRFKDGRRAVDVAFAGQRLLCYTGEAVAEELDLSDLQGNLEALLLLPLTSSERCHGVVVLANPQEDFDQAVRRLGETVSNMAAIALDNANLVRATVDRERLRSQLDLATSVQANMFPKEGLCAAGLQVEGASRPCDETGGDYYTYLEHDGHVHAMIADVTGHGLGAALYTTMAHAVIQQQLRSGVEAADCFEALSTALRFSNSERFMTGALVDIAPGGRSFHYVSAGHNPLLLLRVDGSCEWLDSTGFPLGIMPDFTCETAPEILVAAGDCLVLYTDGFTEASSPDEELYGEERMAACLQQALQAGCDIAGMIDRLFVEVSAWMAGGEHADDLTLVIVRFVPQGGA